MAMGIKEEKDLVEEEILKEEVIDDQETDKDIQEKKDEKTIESEEIERKITLKTGTQEEKEDLVEERIYTVPFGGAWITSRKSRAPKAMRILKAFVEKHMKIDTSSVNITTEVNEKLWSRGIEKPPRKIRIRAAKDKEGIVTVNLAEEQ